MTFGASFGRTFSPTFQPQSQAAASASFSPTDISGLIFWHDFSDKDTLFTDAGSTKVANDGDVIYQINDKSGNGKHAVRTKTGNATAYKTNIKNGLSVGRYGGNYDLHKITIVQTQPFTLFFVAYPTAVSNASEYLRCESANTWLVRHNGTTQLLLYAGISIATSGVTMLNTWHVVSTVTNGSSSAVYIDGINKGTGNVGAGYLNNIIYNQASGWRGDNAECLAYSGVLSDSDRDKVETYLNTKWAIY